MYFQLFLVLLVNVFAVYLDLFQTNSSVNCSRFRVVFAVYLVPFQTNSSVNCSRFIVVFAVYLVPLQTNSSVPFC